MSIEKETRLSIRMSPNELEGLKRYAASQNMTLADWVRQKLLFEADVRDDRVGLLERRVAAIESRLSHVA